MLRAERIIWHHERASVVRYFEPYPPSNFQAPQFFEIAAFSGISARKILFPGNISGGVARLKRFAAQNPRHPKADNALYFAGVGHMAQSDFEEAAGTFERLLSSYPASDEAQAAMLKLAECRVRLKNAREARAVYTQVVNKYPGSAAASEATQRLAALPP